MAQYDPIVVKNGVRTVLGTDTLRDGRVALAGLTTAAPASGDACQISGALTVIKALNTSTSPIVGIYDGVSGSIVREGIVVATMAAGVVLANGNTVYLSRTPGALTNVKPTEDAVHEVGVVVDAATSKILLQSKPVIVLPSYNMWTANTTALTGVSRVRSDGSKVLDYALPLGGWDICYDGVSALWVTTSSASPNNKVYKIDKLTGAVLLTLTPVWGSTSIPTGICSDGTYIYVCVHHGSARGRLFQYALDGTPGWSAQIGDNPYYCCYDSIQNCVWTAAYISGVATKVRCSDGTVLNDWSLPTSNGFGVCFDRASNTVWFSCRSASGYVHEYNASDATFIRTVTAGNDAVCPATDGTYIYIANRSGNTVTKFLISTGAVAGTYATGTNQYKCVCDLQGYLWVARYASASVLKMRCSDGTVIDSYATAADCVSVCPDNRRL